VGLVVDLNSFKNSEKFEFKCIHSPLRYPGGKSRAVPEILKFFPKFEEYREPMVGGGSVFLSAKYAFPSRRYWINDINHDLYAFWEVCKETPELLVEEAEKIKNSKKDGKEIFYEWRYPNLPLTDFELALRYYILNRISFSGLVEAGGFSKESFKERFTVSSTKRIMSISKELKDVKISNLSYEPLLKASGNNVFIYLDPPYYGNKESKLYGVRGYLHTTFNHKKLAEELKDCKFKWLLTYDDNQVIRDYYSFANIIQKELSYGMNNVSRNRTIKGKEIFISNYIPPIQDRLVVKIDN
jgi:DNA adenine methylase